MDSVVYKINSPTVINETLDGESVIIHLKTGYYYSARGAGSVVWDAFERGATIAGVVTLLTTRYSGSDLERRVAKFVEELKSEELIVPWNGDAESGAPAAGRGAATTLEELPPLVLEKFGDMKDLLLLDPIHEVDEQGWPHGRNDAGRGA